MAHSTLIVALLAAAVVGVAGDSVYCRLLKKAFSEASQHANIIKDVGVSVAQSLPMIGEVDVSANHLEISKMNMDGCVASVDEHGLFHVGISHLDIEVKELAWQYEERSWPHMGDHGIATGTTSVSFGVVLDMTKDVDQSFTFELAAFDMSLGAKVHTWITPLATGSAKLLRPLVSKVLQYAVHKMLDQSLTIVREQGGCTFLQDALSVLDLAKLSFTSYEPITVHVPVVGSVNISVNSTHVDPPASMRCEQVGFNGNMLTAHIEDVPFSAGFTWAYQKLGFGHSFWHNQGLGSTAVKGGAMVHIDLLKPADTFLKIDLPILKVSLKADSDAWMYDALTFALVPLVREAVQLLGGRVLAYEIKKCLEDPKCPRSSWLQAQLEASHKSAPVAQPKASRESPPVAAEKAMVFV